MATARELRESAEARRQTAIDRMMQVGAERQRNADAWQARDMKQQSQDQRHSDVDWMGKAGQGAMMGATFGGGPGAAIGAGLGGLVGIMGAMKRRHSEGQGWGKALGRTLFDTDQLTSGRVLPEVAGGLGAAAMALGGSAARGEGGAPGKYEGAGADAVYGEGRFAPAEAPRSGLSGGGPNLQMPALPEFGATQEFGGGGEAGYSTDPEYDLWNR